MACLTSRQTEKSQRDNVRAEKEWESRQYCHHNTDIRQSNQHLQKDLDKLAKHLQALDKNNQRLGECLREYSEIGVAAAKKILKQANKA